MKVDNLFIITASTPSDTEIKPGGEALYWKYTTPGKRKSTIPTPDCVALWHIRLSWGQPLDLATDLALRAAITGLLGLPGGDGAVDRPRDAGITESTDGGNTPVDSVSGNTSLRNSADQMADKDVPRASFEKGARDLAQKEGTVGVYVFAHGEEAGIKGIKAEHLTEIFRRQLELKRVDRLCLVSCGIGNRGPEDTDAGKTYLERACKALATGDYKPLVAGYSTLVTIVSNEEAMSDIVKKRSKTYEPINYAEEKGRKAIRLSNKKIALSKDASDAQRNRNKLVYEYKDGKATRTALANWSEKPT